MDINTKFSEEFKEIQKNEIVIRNTIADIQKNIEKIPALTNLQVCEQLELEYEKLYVYTDFLTKCYFKAYQLYHYTKIVNKALSIS